MTDADYASVASNAANKAIAEAAGPDAVAALAAVGTAKCFSEAASATTYLPAFLAAGYDSYLSNGSTVTVTYKNQRGEISEAITGIASASTYELKAADYEVAWGEEITADYFTPGKPAANYLPRILKEAVKNAEAGDYVIAEYAYSEQEPSTGGGEIPETINKISEIIAPGDYTVQGTVSAAYARGFIVDDTTGAILVYLNAPSNYSLGDVVKVKGCRYGIQQRHAVRQHGRDHARGENQEFRLPHGTGHVGQRARRLLDRSVDQIRQPDGYALDQRQLLQPQCGRCRDGHRQPLLPQQGADRPGAWTVRRSPQPVTSSPSARAAAHPNSPT